jgi:hypothetical protein
MPFAQAQESLTLFVPRNSYISRRGRWIKAPGQSLCTEIQWHTHVFVQAHASGAVPTIIHHVVKSLYPRDV